MSVLHSIIFLQYWIKRKQMFLNQLAPDPDPDPNPNPNPDPVQIGCAHTQTTCGMEANPDTIWIKSHFNREFYDPDCIRIQSGLAWSGSAEYMMNRTGLNAQFCPSANVP